MDDPIDPSTSPWTASPTAKEKNAVQRAVDALLDELAPERAVRRAERIPAPVEQHRTPNGSVLQAATAAVSVSWFPDASAAAPLGELHVVVWRGVVTRRGGGGQRSDGATVVGDLILRPFVRPTGEAVWKAVDGTIYATDALAARCLALLADQMKAGGEPPPKSPE